MNTRPHLSVLFLLAWVPVLSIGKRCYGMPAVDVQVITTMFFQPAVKLPGTQTETTPSLEPSCVLDQ